MVSDRGTRWGQLLLFVALLFGIATMHTVGHPSPGSGHGPHTAQHTVSDGARDEATSPAAHETAVPVPDGGAPVSSMDPASVCLAVLLAWCVALLLLRLAGRRPDGPSPSASRARLPRTLWANGRPPKGVLARVSVLRI
ncbi:DUF6153 family protein [Streptomyces sp. NPDC002889]|uniref:DUF6153 family protein n=1 Tax=Streptomyces sp. NPDC002889 TaxID=3364669 RepID=UPI00368E7920